jgi:hypothetical protein
MPDTIAMPFKYACDITVAAGEFAKQGHYCCSYFRIAHRYYLVNNSFGPGLSVKEKTGHHPFHIRIDLCWLSFYR